jgi:hypothetical protein
MANQNEEDGFLTKIVLTVIVLVLMVPGLIIEPGPVSEIVGIGAIAGIWGLDLSDPEDTES